MKSIRTRHAIFATAVVVAVFTGCQRDEMTIRVDAPPETEVIVGIHAPDGALVRQLSAPDPTETDRGSIVWDGLDSAGQPVKPGTYTWTGVTHRAFSVRVSGGACLGEQRDGQSSPGPNSWVEKGGMPTAVATDDAHVYLGWSGGLVVSCDLDGRIEWSIALPEGASCRALGVDGNMIVALARSGPPDVAVDRLVKLRAKDGEVQPWPAGPTLPITALWPENAESKPALVTAMAARTGRIYLTFSELRFLAVLRTDTGAYLQTVVGPPPGAIDVTPTKTEASDEPGKLVDVDFAIVALQGGTLGKVLFAHDPLWVMMSDFQALDRDERITALTLLGDGAKHHAHSIFAGLGAPFHQVQRRSVLDSEGYLWVAGRAGGRAANGPWLPDALGPINAVALDARGRLWVAEGDTVPARFSVWNTEGNQGRMEREFFGPVRAEDRGAAVLPSDPEVIVGAGCEWRVDPAGGPARCLGVITRDGMRAAGFSTTATGGQWLQVLHPNGTLSVFERRGEGDYVAREQHKTRRENALNPVSRCTFPRTGIALDIATFGPETWFISTADGLNLGFAFLGSGPYMSERSDSQAIGIPSIAQGADGKVYAATVEGGVLRVEIIGLDSITPLRGGKLTVRAPR